MPQSYTTPCKLLKYLILLISVLNANDLIINRGKGRTVDQIPSSCIMGSHSHTLTEAQGFQFSQRGSIPTIV